MNIRYWVMLDEAERAELREMLSGGKHAARKIKRAQILLAADVGVSDEDIACAIGVGGSTVYRTKRRFVEGNLEAALSEEPRPGAARKLSGKEAALLVATACSNPPQGRKRWTLDLLAGEMVRLTEHEALSCGFQCISPTHTDFKSPTVLISNRPPFRFQTAHRSDDVAHPG